MFRRCLYLCLALVLASMVLEDTAQDKATNTDAKNTPANAEAARIDSYGDPLPVGALTRLGKKDSPPGGDAFRSVGMAFSPDSSILAACGFGEKATGRILFWDINTGRTIRTLSEPRRHTWSLAFTPEGKSLVSASGDNTLVLWDLSTGKPVFAKRGPIDSRAYPRSLSLSPDGRTIAFAPIPGVNDAPGPLQPADGLRLWETASGEERAVFRAKFPPPGDASPIYPLAYSPDGRVLAVRISCQYGLVHLMDSTNGKIIRAFGKFDGTVSAACFSPDGTRLIAVGSDQNAARPPGTERPFRVWEVATGKELLRFRGHSPIESYAALSPDGTVLVSTDWCEHAAYLWDIRTGREVAKLDGHAKPVNTVAFSPNGKFLATASQDRSILIWDLAKLPGLKRTVALKKPPALKPLEEAKDRLPQAEVDALWGQLAGDARKAYRAVWSLTLHPGQCLPLLRAHLRPVPRPDAKQLQRFIAALDGDEFNEREAAAKKLEELGDPTAPALRKALSDKPSLELRRRLEPLLAKLQRPYTSPQRLRTFRALEVLEHIGNDEARKLLRTMADGAAGAAETEDAKASLQRLAARRPAEKP